MIPFRLIAAVTAPLLFVMPAFADDLPVFTSPTPDSGATINWNTPGSVTAPPAQPTGPTAPPAKPSPPSSTLAPGSTIHFSDDPPAPGQAVPTVTAVPSSPSNGTVTPVPPNGTTLPPGTTIRWGDAPSSPPPVGAFLAPDLRWRSVVRGDRVEIEVIDPAAFYRVEQVDLVAPDGREYAAQELTRIAPSRDMPVRERATFGVGGWGGSSSGVGMGVGTSFPIGGRPVPPPDPDRNFARTIAHIILSDPASYHRTASAWSVKVHLLDPSGVSSTARFAAPLPPRS